MRACDIVVCAIAAGVGLVGLVNAEEASAARAVFGQITFELSCAVCHGLDAKGDGPMATQLTVPAPDLTLLGKRNGGPFPTKRVTEIINGGQAVSTHGGQMPAWGLIFLKDFEGFNRDSPRDDQALVRRRIDDLVVYLQSIQEDDRPMPLTHVEFIPQPMIYFSARASMEPEQIGQLMTSTFETLGTFMGEAMVTPLGPPLVVYRDWADGMMTVEIGFPVSDADAAKANGDINAGQTPGGHALKAIHRGSYDRLHDTYAAIEAEMKEASMQQSTLMWEIYFGEPGKTPDADLVTEIYVQISAEDAAKLPTN
ncbi:MAG: GyrI-like domain-containing protein [Devosia sp.]